ncbi:hypothetical protein D1007_12521 [Hordeum vulgare]|nr:hypothetical protein D1007_12521 [Hordeum vulgare]
MMLLLLLYSNMTPLYRHRTDPTSYKSGELQRGQNPVPKISPPSEFAAGQRCSSPSSPIITWYWYWYKPPPFPVACDTFLAPSAFYTSSTGLVLLHSPGTRVVYSVCFLVFVFGISRGNQKVLRSLFLSQISDFLLVDFLAWPCAFNCKCWTVECGYDFRLSLLFSM